MREIYATGFYQASRLTGYFVAQIRRKSKFLAAPIFYRQIFFWHRIFHRSIPIILLRVVNSCCFRYDRLA